MGFSRRAKRGIAAFNKVQTSPNRLRYLMKKLTIEAPALAANILNAAQSAVEALNADVQIVPKSENNPVAPEQEGGAEHGVSEQPKADQETAKGTPGGSPCEG